MSFYPGLGRCLFGTGCTIVGAIIAWYIINEVMKDKDDLE